MSELWRPAVEWELRSMIAQLVEGGRSVEVVGHGSLRGVGRPVKNEVTITTTSLRGVTLYQPNELVMSARSGTPLVEIEEELAAHGQMLAFEPMDLGPASGGPAAKLDVAVLQAKVLEDILGIEDIRTDPRVDFVGGIRGTEELVRVVDSGKAKAAFSMYATSLDQLMEISDADEIMPPKSTWFEPKLRDGVVNHSI